MERLTPSMEGYLETIYELCEYNGTARLTDISLKLNVSKASANRAVTLLKEKGLCSSQRYQTVDLTEAGVSLARHVCSRHEIIERFMVKVLKMNDAVANSDACIIEHIISDEAILAMKRYQQLHDIQSQTGNDLQGKGKP